jgi:hypothetical protein
MGTAVLLLWQPLSCASCLPLRWVFCHKAPRQGAVFEELMLNHHHQQQQSGGPGGAGVGRLNPRLCMDDWVEEEMK